MPLIARLQGGRARRAVIVDVEDGNAGETQAVDDALAAEETGLKEGDIILAVDDVRVANGDEALQQVRYAGLPGATLRTVG